MGEFWLGSLVGMLSVVAAGGMFPKDQFDINLADQTVTCPNGVTIPIRPVRGIVTPFSIG